MLHTLRHRTNLDLISEQFCAAVRAKKDWYIKILDKQRDLGIKWAIEAQFLADEIESPNSGSVANGHALATIE